MRRNLVIVRRAVLAKTDTRHGLPPAAVGAENARMQANTWMPFGSASAALSTLAFERDAARVSIPRPAVHVVARVGAAARGGLDLHALGARETVHRKFIPGGQHAIAARLRLGSCCSVLGVPASALRGRVVPLDALWGDGRTQALRERLSAAADAVQAAAILDEALAAGLATEPVHAGRERLLARAAERLSVAGVRTVARELGISERHLRRLFHETVGIGPKAFARIIRFRRALRAARGGRDTSWSAIAADTGYFDQAHLIDEFRAITGATPSAFLVEFASSIQA